MLGPRLASLERLVNILYSIVARLEARVTELEQELRRLRGQNRG